MKLYPGVLNYVLLSFSPLHSHDAINEMIYDISGLHTRWVKNCVCSFIFTRLNIH